MAVSTRALGFLWSQIRKPYDLYQGEKKSFWVNVMAGVVVAIFPGIPIALWISNVTSPETSPNGMGAMGSSQTQQSEKPAASSGDFHSHPELRTPSADPADCDHLASSPDDLTLDRLAVIEHIKDPIAAVKACDVALATPANSDSRRLYFQRGRALEAIGENERAESDYEKAMNLGYPPAQAMFAMAVLVSSSADNKQKKAAAAQLIELQNRAANALYFVGRAECSGIYEKYGIPKNKQTASKHMQVAASLGVEDARWDRCN